MAFAALLLASCMGDGYADSVGEKDYSGPAIGNNKLEATNVITISELKVTVGLSTPQSSQRLVLSLSTNVGGGTITVNGCVSQFVFAFVVWRLNPSSYSIRYCCRPLSSLYGIINCLFVSYFFFNLLIVLLSY